jgi:hypothetical protein
MVCKDKNAGHGSRTRESWPYEFFNPPIFWQLHLRARLFYFGSVCLVSILKILIFSVDYLRESIKNLFFLCQPF